MIEINMESDSCYTILDGIKRNPLDLNEKEILSLISSDLRDFSNNKGSYSNSLRFLDSIILLFSINKDFEPSEDFVKAMLKLRRRYGSIVDELLELSNCSKLLNEYYFQVKDEKESWGIIAPPTMEEICNYVLSSDYIPKKIMK